MGPAASDVICPRCRRNTTAGKPFCESCSAEMGSARGDETMVLQSEGWSVAIPEQRAAAAAGGLDPGTVLADRYEILEVLGEGGMGAVYKARDQELDRLVALKVIRPDLVGSPRILQRFKQELILCRQVTHRNVIRIFDFGSAHGVKFITMEFIEGRDLASLLESRRFTPAEAVHIVRQACRALEAAHSEGVVHRDLKPQNIMIDGNDRARVMDFGLARSVEMHGLTQTGAMIGTPAYMSPEQAKGQPADERSDIFSLGIIFYELLTGAVPFKADTVLASLLIRTQTPARPVLEIDGSIPKPIGAVVQKSLAIDPKDRYQSAAEMLADLDAISGDSGTPVPAKPASRIRWLPAAARRRFRWKPAAAAALLVAAGLTLWMAWRRAPAPSTPARNQAISLLVADFRNETGDAIFSGTLEPMLNFALEGASFVNAYNRSQALRLASQLEGKTGKLDERAARLIAVREGLNVVISGVLTRRGGDYQVSVKAIDAVTGKVMAAAQAAASSKEAVLAAVPKLAAPIRAALGDATPESAQLSAVETFTAGSIEAVHEYAVAQDYLFSGKFEEARQAFTHATELDPTLGRAYAGLAVASMNLERRGEAERYFKLAMTHVDRMTERERYRTRGFYYGMRGDDQKCIEEFGALLNRYPSDTAARNNLALCSTHLRDLSKAIQEMQRAVEISPKHAMLRNNLALYQSYAGDFPSGERNARLVNQLNPSYAKGYIALAFAQLGQGQTAQAAETYRKLEKVNAWGASYASSGMADLAIYEGRYFDAVQRLETGAAADLAARNSELAAAKFAALAYTQLLREQQKPALAAAERALAGSKEPKIRFLAARVFAAAGEVGRARAIARGLASEAHAEPQVYARLIEGEVALKEEMPRRAIQSFTEANKVVDLWIGRFDLGRAYLAAGDFTEADSEFDRCLARRGESLSLFLDEVPTSGYLPPVYYYLGRVRDGLGSPGFAESYRTYLTIRGKAGEDPLLAEVQRRTAR